MTVAIPVELVDHDPLWGQQAAHYAKRLRSLGAILLDVQHIGSTSVPGLIAKPVIDIMGIVPDIADLDARRADVEALGLGWHGEFGVDGRRFCTLDGENGHRLANIHFYDSHSPHPRRHLAFRDYLRAFPVVAAAYGEEKRRAAALEPDSSVAYSAEKNAWIRVTEAAALAWYVGEGPVA